MPARIPPRPVAGPAPTAPRRRPAGSRRTLAAAIAALALAGCASTDTVRYGEVTAVPGAYAPAPAPLSIGEIAAELRSGRDQADLAAAIRERGLLAPARDADVDLLLRQGADGAVIEAVRSESEAILAAPPAPVRVVPYPYPYPYYYGWYPWAPFDFGLWWYGGRYPHYHRPPPALRPPPGPPARPPLPSPRAPLKPSR